MDLRDVRLTDRYDLDVGTVLLSGTQALVRATLMQRARDLAAGLDTAGYVTGYRGSPLGAVDATFIGAGSRLEPAQIRFQPGLNEDLAATALWGTQQAELRGDGRFDGVFGLFYGKGPGIDRSGDVFRHANLAGTSPNGGVLVAMGDDHTCESSTTCHQSEFAMLDAMMPILAPAGVQDLLDMMMAGWGLSRFAGLWVGIKCVKDVVEATGVVDGDPHRRRLLRPDDVAWPAGGLSIRTGDTPQMAEARLHRHKIPAAKAYARANALDGRMHGRRGARIGVVSAGKSWLDTCHALDRLGLLSDPAAMGLTTYKIGMVWPLEPERLADWAEGLDLIIVVEEKRPLIETQIREILYNHPARPRVIGKRDTEGAELFPAPLDLDAGMVAIGLARALDQAGIQHPAMRQAAEAIGAARRAAEAPQLVARTPWFCAGCPHNTSTRVPDGSRAYAGIGCHYMALWMDRATDGHTQMGSEGANWIGEAPFSERGHVFQNMGDGTFNHSGLMAIRAAIAAGTTMTFKILYNDAVAMTGGQPNDGDLTAGRIAAEVLAAGAARVVAVVDEKEARPELPPEVAVFARDRLDAVQRELRAVQGVSVLLYVQTCAAEKRRRRKRGRLPDPDTRVFINPAVCEGCGDCSRQSNCVAILPLETPLGRKRRIDQSACNKDFSCLKGFCPAFVTVEGAVPKSAGTALPDLSDLPVPGIPALDRPWNLLITGIGGTGVVTIGALLSMAAHLEGKAAAEMQMAGLAQKGGAVSIHCRLAPEPGMITAVRLSAGEADAVIAGDLVTAAAPKSQSLIVRGHSRVLLNARTAMTGQFALDRDLALPEEAMIAALASRAGVEAVRSLDAVGLAERTLGDAIFANVVLLGAAWQSGLVPLSERSLLQAIELNGTAVAGNTQAFHLGRWAIAHPEAVGRTGSEPAAHPAGEPFDRALARREAHLAAFQNARLARRYRAAVDRAEAAGGPDFARAVAEGYFRVLAYKDEYEVARLHVETLEAALAEEFDGVTRISLHMAPPLLSSKGDDGRPLKRAFGPWMLAAMRLLRHGKVLRGTPFDPFGWTAERRAERSAIRDYEALLEDLVPALSPKTQESACALARLPCEIRGFGPVKAEAMAQAALTRKRLFARLRAGDDPEPLAQAAE